MRVGLVRHFPVREPWPRGWPTSAELQAWRARYDAAEVQPQPVADLTMNWPCCWSSDLKRAQLTAQAMFRGEIQQLHELREAETAAFATGPLRLPFRVWRLAYRLAWATGWMSQRSLRDDFLSRVRRVVDRIESQAQDVLVVSHAGTMIYLRRELVRCGFQGPSFRLPEHARLYVLERAD